MFAVIDNVDFYRAAVREPNIFADCEFNQLIQSLHRLYGPCITGDKFGQLPLQLLIQTIADIHLIFRTVTKYVIGSAEINTGYIYYIVNIAD